jgi:DNA-binding response OmpR family regulator
MIPDMRILAVEDDKKIASVVVNGLKQSGFAVDHCADGEEVAVLAEATPYAATLTICRSTAALGALSPTPLVATLSTFTV